MTKPIIPEAALGRLRTLELIVGRGEIRASDNLF